MLIDLGPWPVGLAAAVVAGALLWPIGARLGLRPASRAAATALYASAALLVELYSPLGVDGRAAMLLAVAACLAVGGPARNAAAVVACGVAVLAAPIAAVGFLVLLGSMVFAGGVARRLPAGVRWALGWAALAAAGVVALVGARPGLPLAVPPVALGVLTLWTLLVAALSWQRARWLRPVCAAVAALLACAWLPGPDADAVVLVAAVVAVLTVVVAEESRALLARRMLVAAVAATVATTGLLVPGGGRQAPPAVGAAALVDAGGQAAAPVVTVRPLSMSISALGVAGPLGELTADPATGELSAPDDPATAGWFSAGVVPGNNGPAVIGGHVDSRAGPGVFSQLRRLQPGDLVEITRSDGQTVRFSVSAVRLYPKDRFPTEAVYGPAPGPELRLVTCGGPFDRTARSYEDNVVVEAVLL